MAATLDDIYTEVRAMLLGLFSCEAVRGYGNNVPLPKPPFVVMNILNETDAATNEHAYAAADKAAAVSRQSEIQMQLDFYGAEAGQMAQKTVLLWRDFYACERRCMPTPRALCRLPTKRANTKNAGRPPCILPMRRRQNTRNSLSTLLI